MKKFILVLSFLFPVLASAHAEDLGPEMMGGWNMMGWGLWPWFFTLTWLVWLVVGILIIVWLWKKINK